MKAHDPFAFMASPTGLLKEPWPGKAKTHQARTSAREHFAALRIPAWYRDSTRLHIKPPGNTVSKTPPYTPRAERVLKSLQVFAAIGRKLAKISGTLWQPRPQQARTLREQRLSEPEHGLEPALGPFHHASLTRTDFQSLKSATTLILYLVLANLQTSL